MNENSLAELKRLLPQCLLSDQVRIGSRLARGLAARREGRALELPIARWLAEARTSIAIRAERAMMAERVRYPEALPVVRQRAAIVEALRQQPVIIVAGETGSGKTTQLPKMCLEAGLGVRGRIGCTQPRRVAALSISHRLADELEVDWGREVGCKIRFTDQTRPETSIKVMTDGILLAEVQRDPLLAEYDAILVDEAHERSLNIDFLLGHLNQLVRRRDDLKVIITSATIDTDLFSRAFGHAPVIEVSGRLYPVEVRYAPLDPTSEEDGEITYVDAAVMAAGRVVDESLEGDVLIFMPGERDILETCDRLEGAWGERLEVVGLFGRLTAAEQHRIFSPGLRRRMVVATNIAETSLTVPRIRYVIDTGLARVNRYHAGTRTRRLPVEPVSQSSANQRKGRCGRVAQGVCIRLYSEADFAERRPFSEPEIQRCNLADVVLRMKAFGLGEPETFPFVEAPSPRSIQGAYDLLTELGALDENRSLTNVGRQLARLPVDPSMGRMILEAQVHGALKEVLIIAAGLSVQDPRERPLEAKEAAETMHRRFHVPGSDFMALVRIWESYHDTWESLRTQNQLRKFCRQHFLSFVRMREWVDVHDQLMDALAEVGPVRMNTLPASTEAIHRSILAGLCAHVAERREGNSYRTAGGREVVIWPGSVLYNRYGASGSDGGSEGKHPRSSVKGGEAPAWIVAGEIVETSRTFARSVAVIDPEWVLACVPQLCRHEYDQIAWSADAGRVLAREHVIFRGLVLRERRVGYGRVNAAEATRVFIQSALVERDVLKPLGFVEHNERLRQKIELWQTRLRQRIVPDLDEVFAAFYSRRLTDVSSIPDLNRWLKGAGGEAGLCMTPEDVLGDHVHRFRQEEFPDTLSLGQEQVPVAYAYAPSQEHDGVTLRMSVPLAEMVDVSLLEWQVPALRQERVLQLLHALPKALRRGLMPLESAAVAVVNAVDAGRPDFLGQMTAVLKERYGIEIPSVAWKVSELPSHLRPRFEIVHDGKTVAVGRELGVLRQQIREAGRSERDKIWAQGAERWERYDLKDWDFGDLPPQVTLGSYCRVPVHGYPGLEEEGTGVHLRLFETSDDAEGKSVHGAMRLAEHVLEKELAWLRRDLRIFQRLGTLYVTLGPVEELVETAWLNLRNHLLPEQAWPALVESRFRSYVEDARTRIPGAVQPLFDRVEVILKKRQDLLTLKRPFPNLAQMVVGLLPPRFLAGMPFERLVHVSRYLQALAVRAERAAHNPAKDGDKQRRVQPYETALAQLAGRASQASPSWRQRFEQYRWLVEEWKVSVYAQELGTAEPVSPRRLDELVASLQSGDDR